MTKVKSKVLAPKVVRVSSAKDLVKAKAKVVADKKEAVKLAKKTRVTAVKIAKQIVYLAQGVTGKKLQQLKIDANNNYKMEKGSLSFCIKMAIKYGEAPGGFFTTFKEYNQSDIVPANLLKYQSEKQKSFKNHSVWAVFNWSKKFYEDKSIKVSVIPEIELPKEVIERVGKQVADKDLMLEVA